MQIHHEDDEMVDDLKEHLVSLLEVRLSDELLETRDSYHLQNSKEVENVALLVRIVGYIQERQ